MFRLIGKHPEDAVIKVIGVGGGGGNAVTHMINSMIDGVDFICANTDIQALKTTSAKTAVQLGKNITKGLGAGADPEIGRQSAIEDSNKIRNILAGTDMLFITAGMGGGTGTGAAPVIAQIARELGILTVAVVTKPFFIEGNKRMKVAENGIFLLSNVVDSLIIIPNERLLTELDKDVSLVDAFKFANNVLMEAVQGISELITKPGLINVDFADIKTVMSEMGISVIGVGVAEGENRAKIAVNLAMKSSLLDDVDVLGAKGVLVNITAGSDMSMFEFKDIGIAVKNIVSDDATVIIGTAIDSSFVNKLKVTLVVTGLSLNKNILFNKGKIIVSRIDKLSGNYNSLRFD